MEIDIDSIIKTDVPVIDSNATVSKAISEMVRYKTNTILVVDNNKFVGAISSLQILNSNVDTSKTKVKSLMKTPPILNTDSKLKDVIREFIETEFSILPVVDNGEIVGGIYISDIVKSVDIDAKVSDVMSISPATLHIQEPIGKARSLMHSARTDKLLITDDNYRLVGEITVFDLLRLFLSHTRSNTEGQIIGEKAHISSNPVKSIVKDTEMQVPGNMALSEAIKLLETYKTPLPISNQRGEPVGILSYKEILSHLMEPEVPTAFVEIVGLVDEDQFTVGLVKKVIAEYTKKIATYIPNIERVHVYLKRLHDKSAQVEYEITPKVVYGKDVYTATTTSWDLVSGVTSAFEKIRKQIKADFRKY